jgi:hypothetical protein
MNRSEIVILFIGVLIVSCTNSPTEALSTTPQISPKPTLITPSNSPLPSPDPADFGFPDTIDRARHYLFYLHGKIIEDQGIPAVSPDYGEYEYAAILKKLASYDFVVISEPRRINTDVDKYTQKVVGQINRLLTANVPPESITVVGASKGASIAIHISYYLKNEYVNFVLLAICNGDFVEQLQQNRVYLYGNVLSIYDYADVEYAGSCAELFASSQKNGGLTGHDEIVLDVGTGHGILYHPLDKWVLPTVQWAK